MNGKFGKWFVLGLVFIISMGITACGGGGGGEGAANTNPTYTVRYDGNGNTGGSAPVDATNYEQGQIVTVLGNTGNLVNSGYTFAGWNTKAEGSGETYTQSQTCTMGSANLILYAKWTANPTYTVVYNGNGNTGGSVPIDATNYEQGQTVTVLGNTGVLAKTGYSFAGWNTQADENGTTYTQAQSLAMGSANVTLYAKWTAIPAPGAPSDLVAKATSTTSIDLTWTAGTGDVSGSRVEKSTDNINFVEIGSTAPGNVSYSDSGLDTYKTYFYRVKAYNNTGGSAYSNVASDKTWATLQSLSDLVSSPLQSFQGNEITGSITSSGYTVNLLGVSFCMPPSPTLPPATTSTPPNNLYGCINDVSVTMTSETDAVTIKVTAPDLFLDLYITSLVGSGDAYLNYTNAVFTLSASLSTTVDGRKQIAGITNGSFSYTTRTFLSSNSTLNSYANLILSATGSYLENQALGVIKNFMTNNVIHTLPTFVLQ
jgi:uncharacterized repeat protein (TIGR02543 family)